MRLKRRTQVWHGTCRCEIEKTIKYFYKEGRFFTMEKVKVEYPISDNLDQVHNSSDSFVFKSIAASLAGASIPAVIFYFLM